MLEVEALGEAGVTGVVAEASEEAAGSKVWVVASGACHQVPVAGSSVDQVRSGPPLVGAGRGSQLLTGWW